MRWRLYVGLAAVAALSIAAVVVAITSVTSSDDLARVKSALRLQTNCAHIAVVRPSRTPIARRWASLAVRSADVVCPTMSLRVTYAKFTDRGTLDRAAASSLPAGGYCRLGDAIVLGRLAGAASTVLSDMCQSLGGTLVPASTE
jgi:hypothetical protein